MAAPQTAAFRWCQRWVLQSQRMGDGLARKRKGLLTMAMSRKQSALSPQKKHAPPYDNGRPKMPSGWQKRTLWFPSTLQKGGASRKVPSVQWKRNGLSTASMGRRAASDLKGMTMERPIVAHAGKTQKNMDKSPENNTLHMSGSSLLLQSGPVASPLGTFPSPRLRGFVSFRFVEGGRWAVAEPRRICLPFDSPCFLASLASPRWFCAALEMFSYLLALFQPAVGCSNMGAKKTWHRKHRLTPAVPWRLSFESH